PRRARTVRNTATRAYATLVSAAGLPRVAGPPLRRAAVRAGRVGGQDPAPYDAVRRAYSTSRWLYAALAENATYTDQAVALAELRRRRSLPSGLPVTVLAADDPRRPAQRRAHWLTRQRDLAGLLDGTLRISTPSGHLLMLDRPADVADAVLRTHARPPLAEEERARER
ncbi:alpha/beta hydrolase, partial [Streptomyces carpinensis]